MKEAVQNLYTDRANRSTSLSWAFGGISVGIKNNLLGVWILFYYNQVLGLDAYLVSIALAIALVIDAISDPIVGVWSDRVRTRWGRRHPFMYAAVVPFTASYFLILQEPAGTSDENTFFRLLILMVVMRISMTFYEVPRGALGPELSKDYDQRNTLAGLSSAFGWFGGAVLSHYVMSAYLLEGSFSDAEGYKLLGFWGGCWLFLGTLVASLGTHRTIPSLYQPPTKSLRLTLVFAELRETLSNRNWLILFAAGCVYAIQVGADTGTTTYYNEYLWQWRPEEIAIFAVCQAVAVIVASLLAPYFSKGRNKKNVAVAVFLLATLIGPLPYFLRLVDPLTDFSTFFSNGTDYLWWTLLIHSCTANSLAALGFIYVASMGMEIVEEVQATTGRREEALLGTASSMMHKLIGAGGTLLAGVIVSFSGFDDPNLTYETATTSAITSFSWIHVGFSFFLPLISTALVAFFKIERDDHEARTKQLGYAREKA